MKVILNQDVPKLGLKGEVKQVSAGHARNYLIPKGLVKPANKVNLAELARTQETRARIQRERLAQAEKQVKSLAGKTFKILVEAGEKGQLFKSVDSAQIAQVLTEEGFSVDKEKIMLEYPIKKLGQFDVSIKLTPELVAKTRIEISER